MNHSASPGARLRAHRSPFRRRHLNLRFVLPLVLALFLWGCSDDDSPTDPAQETGTVTGQVTAANGTTPIQGATVRLAPQGAAMIGENDGDLAFMTGPETTTDDEGRYTLEGVPAGNQTLLATRGVFRVTIPVQVTANEVTEAPVAPLDAEGELAYVSGMFDNIQTIVRDELGTELTQISASDLADPSVTSQYRFIFINCGVSDWSYADDPDVRDNLLAFMAQGGALYVSDLEMPLVQSLFPNAIPREGDGDSGVIEADVVSQPLRAFIGGQSTVDIAFNLDGWAAMPEVSSGPEILLRGDYYDDWEGGWVQNAPLAITLSHGAGQLVYTSFHTNAAATEDQISVLRYFIYGFGDVGFASLDSADFPALSFRDHFEGRTDPALESAHREHRALRR
jgi:hypothetical protein